MIEASDTDKKQRNKKAQDLLSPAEQEIRALVELCRAGKLFAVQDWIAAGKPVNPPPSERKGIRPQTPLDVGIDRGFHSLIEVLLKAGADIQRDKWNGPMDRALGMRRLDIIQLLVEHGYDPTAIRMDAVFGTWDPDIMEFFIEKGADLEDGFPLAEALCHRTRTALRIFKQYRDRFPHFQKQANVALRHHCRQGDLKWVSLMLWAGADPYESGSDRCDDDDDDTGISALEFAALYSHFEVFNLRGVKLNPEHPALYRVLRYSADSEEGLPLAEKLLNLGVKPNDQENGGCSAIQYYLERMSFVLRWNSFGQFDRPDRNIDVSDSREKMKGIHVLAKSGARWCPQDAREIADARRSLLKMIPDYSLEFVWIMAKYKSASKADIAELVRTPSMKRHLAKLNTRLQELLQAFS